MLDKMAVFSVYRHKKFRPDRFNHVLQLSPVGMAGRMNSPHALVKHLGAQAIEIINDPGNGFDISRNKA